MSNPTRSGDDPDRWRSRKTAGNLKDLGPRAVRQFKAMILVHRWELWRNAEQEREQ
jgi:hypothetical protein